MPILKAASISRSICWADIFTPMGIPPVVSLTVSANLRKSSTDSQSGKRGGEIAAVPSSNPLTSAILPVTFWAGRCPPTPVLVPFLFYSYLLILKSKLAIPIFLLDLLFYGFYLEE